MSAPLFSIVTPVYEPPVDVFRETFASVVAQEFDDWEWMLVDDCSTDADVRDFIRAQAATDPRIRLIERDRQRPHRRGVQRRRRGRTR